MGFGEKIRKTDEEEERQGKNENGFAPQNSNYPFLYILAPLESEKYKNLFRKNKETF